MSGDPLKTLRLQKRLDAAASALAEGRLDEAREIYSRVLEEEPGHAGALHGLGVLHVRIGQTEEGEKYLRQAVETAPEQVFLLNDLGEALRLLGRRTEARDAYEAALRIDPNDARVHNNMGALLLENEPESAQQHFLAAIRLAPDDAHPYNNLGVLMERQGRYSDALACYEAAVAIDPAYQTALENHQALLSNFPELLEDSLKRLLAKAETLLGADKHENG